MQFDTVWKKSTALLAAMLTMAVAWSFLHLPYADMQMVTFAFLSSAALCIVPDFRTRLKYCIQMTCAASAAQFIISITADYPLLEIIASTLFSFFILAVMPDRQNSIIVLIAGFLTLFAAPGISQALNRCADIAFAGAVVLLVTTLSNIFSKDATNPTTGKPYTLQQAAAISVEIASGFVIVHIWKHPQAAWIILTILFIHMAENPRNSVIGLVKQRIAAVPLGILAGGFYLACFNTTSCQMIYIVPVTGTLCFFLLYLKNDYFLFSFLFIFTLTLFTDWMLGTGKRFHFADVMIVRSMATVIGGVLLLCGKNMMQKETIL